MMPFWNIVSLALPAIVFAVGAIIVATGPRDSLAGGIGQVLMLVIATGVASILGEIAAIVALVKGERLAALSIAGVIVNLLILVPAALLVSRVD